MRKMTMAEREVWAAGYARFSSDIGFLADEAAKNATMIVNELRGLAENGSQEDDHVVCARDICGFHR